MNQFVKGGLFIIGLTVFSQSSWAIKQRLGIGGFAGFSRQKATTGLNHITAGLRLQDDIGSIFRIGADGKFFFKKNGNSIIQPKLFFNLLFGRGTFQPFLGGNGSFNFLRTAGQATVKKFGFGGQLGINFSLKKNFFLFFEGQFDLIFTQGTKTKIFGGIGGLMFQF